MEFCEDWTLLADYDDLEAYLDDYCEQYSVDAGNLLGEPEEYPCLVKHAYDADNDEYRMVCVYPADAEILVRAAKSA